MPDTTNKAWKSGPFWEKCDWLAAGIVLAISLFGYVLTLAPSVTLEHSGALAVAADSFGIGRVPGYPVWHLCGKLFTFVFSFVRYRGHPNPAWALNLMSAFFGSLSAGAVALLVSRVGRELAVVGSHRERVWKTTLAAIISGVAFAFGQTVWSQAVITETHTLTLFFIILFLVSTLAWISRPTSCLANMTALIFGVGIAQSHILVLLVPPFLLAMASVDRKLSRNGAVAAIPLCMIGWLVYRQRAPDIWTATAAAAGVALVLCLAARFLPRGRLAASMLFLVLCGLSLYAYLPIASECNPPMNWGYPRTWEGFRHVISRGQYERVEFTNVFGEPLEFLSQLEWYLRLLIRQFIFPIGLFALCPLVRISRFRGPLLRWWLVCLFTFFMVSLFLVSAVNPQRDIQDTLIQRVRFIPSFALWAVFVGLGIVMAIESIERLCGWGGRS